MRAAFSHERDAGLPFRRAAAQGYTAHCTLPIHAGTPIGSILPYYARNHEKIHGRPGLVVARYTLKDPAQNNSYGRELAALEMALRTTQIERGFFGDSVFYHKPEDLRRAVSTKPGKFVMSNATRLGNHPRNFPQGARGFGVIDPTLWPELIAARVDALLYNASREEICGRDLPENCWQREGLVLDLTLSDLADRQTFASDVPALYGRGHGQGTELKPWCPPGMRPQDIETIIDLVANEGPKGRFKSVDHHKSFMGRRRAALRAALPHVYTPMSSATTAIPEHTQ